MGKLSSGYEKIATKMRDNSMNLHTCLIGKRVRIVFVLFDMQFKLLISLLRI